MYSPQLCITSTYLPHVLQRGGTAGASTSQGGGDSSSLSVALKERGPWGFASGMPSIDELFNAAAAKIPAQSHAAASSTASALIAASPDDPKPGSDHPPNSVIPTTSAGLERGNAAALVMVSQPLVESPNTEKTYVQRLGNSRAFHCPDATQAMTEACGAARSLEALQVRSIP